MEVWSISLVSSMKRPMVFSRSSLKMLVQICASLGDAHHCCRSLWLSHIHWAHQVQNCYCSRRRLCPQAFRAYTLLFWCLIIHCCSGVLYLICITVIFRVQRCDLQWWCWSPILSCWIVRLTTEHPQTFVHISLWKLFFLTGSTLVYKLENSMGLHRLTILLHCLNMANMHQWEW